MQEVFLGEYIRQKRIEQGLTQEQVCDGICSTMTLSRLENGRQNPSRNVINALLQRLGTSQDGDFALLSKNEIEIAAIQKEITSCYVHGDVQTGLKKLQELEEIAEKGDRITEQFILRTRVLLGKADRTPYSFDKKLSMLMEAIYLTVPKFDLEEIGNHLYSFDEVKIINQIAGAYSENGQNKKATDIYYQLLKYIRKHFRDALESNGMLPMVTYNYARELDICRRYEDALEIAEEGSRVCVKYGHYQFLPGHIAIMAECYHILGKDDKSKEKYYQAYFMYRALEEEANAEIVKKEAVEYLGLTFEI